MEKYGKGAAKHSYSKKPASKPAGNSGLYGRVTKKQMGGMAKPVGMSGPAMGIVAGDMDQNSGRNDYYPGFDPLGKLLNKRKSAPKLPEIKMPDMRTSDFRDEDGDGTDDRDQPKGRVKSRMPMPGSGMPDGTGPIKPPKDPTGSGLPLPPRRKTIPVDRGTVLRSEDVPLPPRRNSPPKDQLNRQKVQTVLDRLRGSTPENQPGRPPSGSMSKFRDFIKNANADSSESGAPRLPGGGRLTPPVAGPDPDYREMRPRRFAGMGASIIDALGIKSDKMGDRSRDRPPRPKTKGDKRGRGRRP